MKKAVKLISCVVIMLSLLSQTAFTFQNGEWMHVESFEDRSGYIVDRGEICKYLIDLYQYITQEEVESTQNTFWDLDETEYPYVLRAHALGFINGTDQFTLSPKNSVLRGDLAVMLFRLVKKIDPNAYTGGAEGMFFPDYVPQWQIESLQFAFSRGITNGHNYEKIGAYDPLTLREAMDMIDKTMRVAPAYTIVRPTFDIKKAYLTFDDTVSDNTYSILDTLDTYGVKATFFLNFDADPDVIRRMRDSGHTIGNHTFSHNYSTIYQDPQSFWSDFDQEQQYLENILGYSPRLMRFPGGSNNTVSHQYGGKGIMYTLTAQARDYGYLYFDWNISSGDASGGVTQRDTIVRNVLDSAVNKQSAIILMHQSKPKTTTAEALPEIIEGLIEMGFIFLPLSENSICPQFLK